MRTEPETRHATGPADPPPADLSHAGAVVDKAIEYMLGQQISSIAIASALLGGSLGLLARTLSDEAILRILDNARTSVREGDLRRLDGQEPEGPEVGSAAPAPHLQGRA
jgi:hypothetical protein